MEELVEHVKQLTNKLQLHTREIQWLTQLYEHVQQNINLDLLDPPTTVAQICMKIIEIIHREYSTNIQTESNSKNFVLPVDALIASIAEIKMYNTAFTSNLDNLWHDKFYSYLSPTPNGNSTSTDPDTSALNTEHLSGASRFKPLPLKQYLLIARCGLTTGSLGLPLLALHDNTGEIPFEWTGHMSAARLNALSIITDWSYIPYKGVVDTGYIELTAIDSCHTVCSLVSSAQIWPDTLTTDWHKHRALSIEECMVSRDKTAHLVGTVTAISPIIQQSAHHSFYFVELSAVTAHSSHTTLSTTVLVTGALTFTRRVLRVGQIYFITNLQLATLFPNSENERRTFTTSNKSRVHVIDSVEQLNELWLTRERINTRKRKSSNGTEDEQNKKRARADVNVLNSSLHIESSASQLPSLDSRVSYSGVLTHYCGNCVYLLDDAFKLYVTQYDLEDTVGHGLRVGAHITAHNIHPIRTHQGLHGFGCCVYSTVEVTAFSRRVTDFKPQVQSTNLYKPYWDALSFTDFAAMHALFACLREAFPDLSKQELLGAQMQDLRHDHAEHGVLATLVRECGVTLRHDTIYNQFFAHSTHCNHTDANVSHSMVQLMDITALMKRAQDLAADLHECDHWACKFTGHLVAKCVLLDRKGVVSLHLLQRDDAIPVVIAGDTRLITDYIDALLLIRSFDIVVENLRPPDAKQDDRYIAWLLVNTHHVTIVHRASNIEPSDPVPSVLDSCTWPTRHEGQLRSQCSITTSLDTRREQALTGLSAALTRYMTAGMTLRLHLSRADTFDCRDIKFVTCPHDITRKLSVRAVLDVTEPNNQAGEIAVLSGLVTHIQLLEDDNSPAVYSLDYRPQRKICEGKLVVKLQDLDGPDAVDVYIRLDVFVYPLGLVPGTRVTFYNVERRLSKSQSIYCTMTEESGLVFHEWDKRILCDTSNRSAPLDLFDATHFKHNTPLIEFQDPNHIKRVFVRVCACLEKIISIKAEWLCNHCKRLSVNELCIHGCKNKGFMFSCSLVATIDDGSNQVEALVKGDLVWQLLNLNAEQTNGIMEHTMAIGPIKYTHGRYYCSDKLISAHQTRELQIIDEQINNDDIYKPWLFYGRQYYKTDGAEDEKSPPARKIPHGLERAVNSTANESAAQSSTNNTVINERCLSQCYFDVRHAMSYVAVAEAYLLLHEMTK